MEYKLEDVKNVGKRTAEIMRANGIKSVEDLASIDIKDLLKVKGIGESTGKTIIENAKLMLKSIKKDEKKETIQLEKVTGVVSSFKPPEKKTSITNKTIHKPTEVIQKKNDFDKKVSNFKKNTMPPKKISEPEIKQIEKHYLKEFFNEDTIQRIQFLSNRTKEIEQIVYKDYNNFILDDLDLFLEYITNLNINYKNSDHNLILKELNLTQSFYDPIIQKTVLINDLMFECARASWVLAKIYVFLSGKFETEESLENAILAMVKASQIYKTAAFFSSSAVHQEIKGLTLNVENLELNSEECRILAQGIGALREEKNNNLLLAANLYAGLSALSKRLLYLKDHDKKKKWQIEAKLNYEMGKSYQMRVIAKLNSINQEEFNKESLETLGKLHLKAYYYFSNAQKKWEKMLRNLDDLLDEEIKILKSNLSVVQKNIIETEVKNADYNEIKNIQDFEPIIIIPETFSLIVPKSLTYLTKYSPKDVNINRLKKFRNLILQEQYSLDKKQELLNIKSAIGRTIRQINVLYDNDDIEVDKYVELLEKYNIKLKMVDGEIANLENLQSKAKKS